MQANKVSTYDLNNANIIHVLQKEKYKYIQYHCFPSRSCWVILMAKIYTEEVLPTTLEISNLLTLIFYFIFLCFNSRWILNSLCTFKHQIWYAVLSWTQGRAGLMSLCLIYTEEYKQTLVHLYLRVSCSIASRGI